MIKNFFVRVALAGLLSFTLHATSAQAQTPPSFRAASGMDGSGTLSFPTGSVSTDWLVMYVIANVNPVPTPSGWTLTKSYGWSAYGFYSQVFTRQKGSDTSVTLSPYQGGAMIVAYQNVAGIGAVGTYAESGGATLTMNSITPQSANSIVIGIVSDRDPTYPTPPAGFTSRYNFTTQYFGQNFAEKVYGSTAATGTPAWGQWTSYPATGVLIELLSASAPPTIAAAFSPASIPLGSTSTLTFTVSNPNVSALTNLNFTDALTNMTVASSSIGGTCSGTSNSPTLTTGATSLNLTIASLAAGSSCTVSVQVSGTTGGTQSTTTSGVTSTEMTSAGPASNTATLMVSAVPAAPVQASQFSPAFMAAGSTSTLTIALTSQSNVALSNVHFASTLANMTVASTAIGGTCSGASSSPALTTGATSLNMTIASLPAAGCTVSVQVTSTTLGSNLAATTGATATEMPTTGNASSAYLTVNEADVGFYYVHSDHLGTPRAITRPADNAVLWKWDNTEPFGNNQPDENPSGVGTLKYNWRFAGQFYDQETGTHYNYFRDYDSATGRYVQSDPIGLDGGISTYAYVGANPLWNIDPLGLAKPDEKSMGGGGPTIPRGNGFGYPSNYVPPDPPTPPSLLMPRPAAGGGARLSNLSDGDAARIQNAANRSGASITVVGSRARGTAAANSDWDYIIEGGRGGQLCVPRDVRNSLPEGPRGLGEPRNQDFFKAPVDTSKPFITFSPSPK